MAISQLSPQAVHGPEYLVHGPFRVRHHAKNVPARIHDPGDSCGGPVRVRFGDNVALGVAITQYNMPLAFEALECLGVGVIVSVGVCDRNSEYVSDGVVGGVHGVRSLDRRV